MTDAQPIDAKIKKGAPNVDPICYQTTQDIVIPAGTLMRHYERGKVVECPIGFGPGVTATFSIPVSPEAVASGHFRLVMA